jgi:hypothetical protein
VRTWVPRRGRWAGLAPSAALGVAAVVAAGCIGTTDRTDFNREIQARGGGLTSELPTSAVDAVEASLGVIDFEVRTLTVTPLDGTVVLEVRAPAAPENLDRYVVRRGSVSQVEPIRLAADDVLDTQTFPVSGVALDQVEAMVDTALAEFVSDGYVTSMTVTRTIDDTADDIVVMLALESPRAAGTARFTGDGELIEVVRA